MSTASALFVDPAAHDYRLKDGSPAIDAGTNLSPNVVADIDGTTRPQRLAYDIGCYEMRTANGRIDWKDARGRTLKEIQEAAAAEV